MVTNFASNYDLDKSDRCNYMSIFYSYFSTVIWKYVVFQEGAPRKCRHMKAFFRIPLSHCITITVCQLFIEKNILFRSIVLRIKNFYKHVDITPSVPLLHLLVTPIGASGQVLWGSRRGRVCYLIAIPSRGNESDLNKN